MTLEVKEKLYSKTDNYSLHFEVINKNSKNNLEDNMAKVGLYLWKCRNKEGINTDNIEGNREENKEENNKENNAENKEEKKVNIIEQNPDYYIFYKIQVTIKNDKNIKKNNYNENKNISTKRKRSGTLNKNNSKSEFLNKFHNSKGGSLIKKNIEMKNLNIHGEKKEENEVLKGENNDQFGIDNQIDSTLTFLNFTNYIIDGIYTNDNKTILEMKTFFNNNFINFYQEIALDNNIELCLEDKIVYLKSKNENNNNNNNEYLNGKKNIFDSKKYENSDRMDYIPKEEIYSKNEKKYIDLIKSNFKNKLNSLNPYILKSDFEISKEEDKEVNTKNIPNIRNLKNIEQEDIDKNQKNFDNNDELNNNIIKIKEKNLNIIDTGNEANLIKKGILLIISLILFIIILFKLF